jgi:hypothetical protein
VVAIKLQRLWRAHYRRKVLPRKQAERERAVVYIVQKCCRGYLGRNTVIKERAAQVVQRHYEYFQE